MVHLAGLKTLLHWVYLGLAGFLGAYSYAVLHAGHPAWTDAARYAVLPLLQVSGVLAWAKTRAIQLAKTHRSCLLGRLAA